MKCYFLGLAPAILHHDSHLLTKEFESNPCISFHVEVQAQENGHSRETVQRHPAEDAATSSVDTMSSSLCPSTIKVEIILLDD